MEIKELNDVKDEKGEGVLEGRLNLSFKAKRTLVGAGARILFYPTLWYNVFRNKIQTEFRWWDEVDQFILLGAVPFPKDVPKLKQLGVSGVITLNEPYETLVPSSLYQDHGIDHLVIPTRDFFYAPSLSDIRRAVEFIHRKSCLGQTTYVHCKAGRGRSTTIVLCYLVEHKQMTPSGALEYVRSRRPRVHLHHAQWKAVQDYSNEHQSGLSTCGSSNLSVDGVLITKADLEGYSIPCESDREGQQSLPSRRRPMIEKLYSLFTSMRVSGGAVLDRLDR